MVQRSGRAQFCVALSGGDLLRKSKARGPRNGAVRAFSFSPSVMPSASAVSQIGPQARAEFLGRLFAAVALAGGLLGLAGALTGVTILAEPVAAWPPLHPLDALGLVALGAGLLGYQLHRPTLARAGAIVAVLTVLAASLLRAGLFHAGAPGPPFASITLAAAAVIGLLPAAFTDQRERAVRGFGTSGFMLIALSGTLLLARATGVLDPLEDTVVAGVSLQVLLGALCLGLAFLATAWSPGLAETATWLPLAVGLSGVITVMVLRQALSVRERVLLAAQAAQAAEGERHSLQRELAVTARTLQRVAEWRAERSPRAARSVDLEALRRDLAGLEAAAWLVPGDRPSEPLTSQAADPAVDSVWRAYLGTGPLADSVAYLPLDGFSRSFVVLAPACTGGACAGAVGGVLHSARLFQALLADTTRGFHFSIAGGGRPLDGARLPGPPEQPIARSVPLEVGAVRLILTAWPTPVTRQRAESILPDVIAVLGLMMSGLMATLIALGQRARRSAREIERGRLALALERATDGIWEWDLVTGSAVRSHGMLRYLGYEAQSLPELPQTWLGLIHPEDRERVELALAQHLRGERPAFEAEYRVRSSSGAWHAIMDRGRVTDRDGEGRPLRVLGISADVTESRAAELAQEASERRFRTMFDSGFQPKLLLDANGVVIEVNRAALEGRAGDEGIRGQPVWQVLWWALDPATGPRLQEAIARVRAGRGSVVQYEEEVQGPHGQTTILEIGIKPIEAGAGQPAQLLLEARDITTRRRAEAALQEVDTLTTMGRIAARVAHEINNPLAGIQNAFLLIKGSIPGDHPHFRYVGAIDREIGRIAAVTRQLYETYRPETDQTGETSVRTVLGDAVAFLEQVNRASRVRVELQLDGLPTVIGLPSSMLRQIAYNLVQNAIEASPPDSVVTIAAGLDEGRLGLRVRDHGPGVPPELRERIFEPFFSTKDRRIRTSGMGLGLALVRRTVAAAGGTIMVQDAAGGGSEFVISIPLHPRNQDTAP